MGLTVWRDRCAALSGRGWWHTLPRASPATSRLTLGYKMSRLQRYQKERHRFNLMSFKYGGFHDTCQSYEVLRRSSFSRVSKRFCSYSIGMFSDLPIKKEHILHVARYSSHGKKNQHNICTFANGFRRSLNGVRMWG